MIRRTLFFFITLGMVGGLMACSGNDKRPTWEVAFDPGEYYSNDYYIFAIEVFQDQLYVSVSSPAGGQVFRSPDGKSWSAVTDLGFGLGAYEQNMDMIVFKDRLYILPNDQQSNLPGQILRTPDGTNWENVTADQSEDPHLQYNKMAVFNDNLYIDASFIDLNNKKVLGQVWRSENGNGDYWEKAAEFPFWLPGSFEVFNNTLYLASGYVISATSFSVLPGQVMRSQDGINWEIVVSDGFGNPSNDSAGGFTIKDDYLYIGIGTGPNSVPKGGQIYRTQDGKTWATVVEDGFGNSNNFKVEGLITYKNYLYAYTYNETEGCMVFRSKDGTNWIQVNEPGWGNPKNQVSHLSSDQVVFKDELYMGIFGQQGGLMKMVGK